MVKKVYKVIWSPRSLSTLKKIEDYIQKKSPQGARKVTIALLELGFNLETFPERNPADPWLTEQEGNLRSLSKWNYKIVY